MGDPHELISNVDAETTDRLPVMKSNRRGKTKPKIMEPKPDGTIDWHEMVRVLDARQFKMTVLDPCSWLHKANGLYVAANRLFDIGQIASDRLNNKNGTGELKGQDLIDFLDSQNQYSIYLLLIGYAVENLIKGIVFAKDPNPFKSDALDHMSHNLVGLFEKAGLIKDDDTDDILNALEEYVTWRGKYLVTKNITKFRKGDYYPMRFDKDKIDRLVSYLAGELNKMPNRMGEVEYDDSYYD